MKKALRIIGAVVVALFVGYTFYFLWKQSQPQPVVFELVTPEQRTVQKKTIATGTVEARQQVELKPQVTGIISELRVKAGDRVNTGDVIAVLRVIPDMSQLNDAQSKVESARISLDEIEREAQSALVAKIMSRLTIREQEIVSRYFGIGREEQDASVIAEEMGLTEERIRQLVVNEIPKKMRRIMGVA